jgi:hypothetical protein
MLPLGLKITDFTKVNKLFYTYLPFDLDEELERDSKIFGIKYEGKKRSIKNKSKLNTTKKNNKL